MPDAEGAERSGERATLVGGGSGEAMPELCIARVDPQLAPVFRVDQPELTKIGKRLLARVADLDCDDIVSSSEPEERDAPIFGAAEVGDHQHERPLPCSSACPGERLTQRCAADWQARFVEPFLAQRAEQPEQPCPALSRRCRPRLSIPERDDPEPVTAAGCNMTDRKGDALRDVGLTPVRCTEAHRRRRVEHQPGNEDALRKVDADMRLAGARGHVPVDLADVVSRDIRPHLSELCSGATHARPVVARQESAHAPPDREVECVQERRRDDAWPRPIRRRSAPKDSECAHAAETRARSVLGTGTDVSTESRIWSGLTSSASAW